MKIHGVKLAVASCVLLAIGAAWIISSSPNQNFLVITGLAFIVVGLV